MSRAFDAKRLMRPIVDSFAGYKPVEPFEKLSEKLGIPIDEIVKLDANENPYGCAPKVREAIAAYDGLHIYPDSFAVELSEHLERYLGVSKDMIVTSNGSDEMLDFLARLFISPGDNAITAVPTFPMYRFNVTLFDGQMREVPRTEAFELDVDAILAAVDERTKLILVATPNNPTGNSASEEQVRRLLQADAMVVIDEAYAEFSGASYVSWVAEHENLIVLRTFSKWAGLAGLRVGYGIFHPNVIQWMWRVKPPYTVNVLGQAAAIASLADKEYLMDNVRKLVAERERLAAALRQTGYLEVYPSEANYLYVKFLEGDALRTKQELEKRGILVRYYDEEYLRGGFRITVGKPEHTDKLVAALREIRASESA